MLNLFVIGIGNIGCHLLQQLAQQHDRLLHQKALELKVVGIANSRLSLFDREGIDISNPKKILEECGSPTTIAEVSRNVIGMNIFNSVVVDCTASTDVADQYHNLLGHYVNVVTANKIAASGDYDRYSSLKQTARKKDVKFLFETNVGAGLPIINTINNLINSGDHIICIEAVVSGSLNYIFNSMSAEVSFTDAIRMAREMGYSEPDPRVDLCGADVVRKIVILARESGYQISCDDVTIEPLLPAEVFEGSVDDFFAKAEKYNRMYEDRRLSAENRGRKLRFVATLSDGKATVGLREVESNHPLYSLEGSNNVILLTTERYKEYPMVIKGYGAGADVTAAGVFADIMSIANIH